jgi:hypothetical protein
MFILYLVNGKNGTTYKASVHTHPADIGWFKFMLSKDLHHDELTTRRLDFVMGKYKKMNSNTSIRLN